MLLISDFNKNFSFWEMKSGGLSWGEYYKETGTGLEILIRIDLELRWVVLSITITLSII